MDLAWNNLQWLIYHKTKPSQTNQISESILAYFNNPVSILPLISSSFNFFPLWGPFRVHQLQLVSPSPSYLTVFQFFGKVQVLSINNIIILLNASFSH